MAEWVGHPYFQTGELLLAARVIALVEGAAICGTFSKAMFRSLTLNQRSMSGWGLGRVKTREGGP